MGFGGVKVLHLNNPPSWDLLSASLLQSQRPSLTLGVPTPFSCSQPSISFCSPSKQPAFIDTLPCCHTTGDGDGRMGAQITRREEPVSTGAVPIDKETLPVLYELGARGAGSAPPSPDQQGSSGAHPPGVENGRFWHRAYGNRSERYSIWRSSSCSPLLLRTQTRPPEVGK